VSLAMATPAYRVVILFTLTLANASRARCIRARSFNGSSLEQRMSKPHDGLRITSLRTCTRASRGHQHHCRASCISRGDRAFLTALAPSSAGLRGHTSKDWSAATSVGHRPANGATLNSPLPPQCMTRPISTR
jgi:hypothetical protein